MTRLEKIASMWFCLAFLVIACGDAKTVKKPDSAPPVAEPKTPQCQGGEVLDSETGLCVARGTELSCAADQVLDKYGQSCLDGKLVEELQGQWQAVCLEIEEDLARSMMMGLRVSGNELSRRRTFYSSANLCKQEEALATVTTYSTLALGKNTADGREIDLTVARVGMTIHGDISGIPDEGVCGIAKTAWQSEVEQTIDPAQCQNSSASLYKNGEVQSTTYRFIGQTLVFDGGKYDKTASLTE